MLSGYGDMQFQPGKVEIFMLLNLQERARLIFFFNLLFAHILVYTRHCHDYSTNLQSEPHLLVLGRHSWDILSFCTELFMWV